MDASATRDLPDNLAKVYVVIMRLGPSHRKEEMVLHGYSIMETS